jgi:hypothetical protein
MQALRTPSRCFALGMLSPGLAVVMIKTADTMLNPIISLPLRAFIDT